MAHGHKKACVIGWPITHSRSPLIHNYWLNKYDLSGIYEPVPVRSDELVDFLDRIRQSEFAGCNVTIPHKEEVFKLVEPADPQTAKLKAVNTVYIENGKLMGTSTDGAGFIAHLQTEYSDWPIAGRNVGIFGAGGAARSIICSLLSQGTGQICLTNRTIERAQAIADEFGDKVVVSGQDEFERQLGQVDLLINTTALGMTGKPPLVLSLELLKPSAIVADIVYVPLQTELLKSARQRGHGTLDGLGMLLHQAVPGFEKWFGIYPEVTAQLRELVVADLLAD